MPVFKPNEIHPSQITALQLLINLGYNYLPPEEIRRQRRGKLSNVLLEDILSNQLQALNRISFKGQEYLFSEANIQEAILRLKNIRYDGLLKTNEKIYDYLTLGTSLEQTIDGDSKSYNLRYIDWRDWKNNVFHVTADFSVESTRSITIARPDIVLFVNGIPFVVIECKSPTAELKQAISQCIHYQRDECIPQLFTYTQLLLATNNNEAKYATIGTPAQFWGHWREELDQEKDIATYVNKTLPEEVKNRLFPRLFASALFHLEKTLADGERKITAQDSAIYSLCRPERLIELVYQFTVFEDGVRRIARYHQFFTVKNVLQRVKETDAQGRRRGGVIWQTQGSGKSLTMVMIARAILLDYGISKPRIVLVTDRVELDNQIRKTFASCGMQPEQANSGRLLVKLIEEKNANIITTLIHKFNAALGVRKFSDPDHNIFILVDEIHRTQNKALDDKMRQVFPYGCYLGFTGIPLTKKQKNTFLKFGGLIEPSYTIHQAIEDRVVVPLLYESRHSQWLYQEIDTWSELLSLGLTDEQTTNLKHKYDSYHIIDYLAADISEHYRQNWQGTGLKALLIAPGQASALKYKQFLDKIGYVTSEVIISPPDTRESNEEVEAEPSDEVQKFWQQMMKRYGSEREYNQQIINSFKYGDTPEILIVVNKLLTGLDVPRNTVLYLTRPLIGHNLLQAIACVNLPYFNETTQVQKEFGYIVDYVGVFHELDKALNQDSALEGFDEEDLIDTLTNISTEISKLPQYYANLLDIFKEIQNSHDEEAYEQLLTNEKLRDEFYGRLAQYTKTLAIALSSEKFLLETPDHQINCYKKDLKRFQNLKAAVKRCHDETVDYRDLEPKIQKLLNTHISATEVVQIAAPLNIFNQAEMQKLKKELKAKPASLADTIASATKRTITERMEEDPAFYRRFAELIQKTIDDFRAQRISEAEYLRKAEEIRDGVVNRQTDNHPEELRHNSVALAFYGLLKPFFQKYSQNQTEIDTLSASAAIALYDIIDSHKIVDWINNETVQKNMMNDIDDYLYDVVRDEHGIFLSQDHMDEIIQESLQLARLCQIGSFVR
ncbi:type I restriction endonuclease subunit R [Anabaena azotica]|uniref:type I restriction endonuclease subunit R n=1 Tax=Anabaena azotica TaxID=197653 RepID=UPI0039A62698